MGRNRDYIVRGSSWLVNLRHLVLSHRSTVIADYACNRIGLRLVRSRTPLERLAEVFGEKVSVRKEGSND